MTNFTKNEDLRNFLEGHFQEADAAYIDNGCQDYDEGFRDAIEMIKRELTNELKCMVYSFDTK